MPIRVICISRTIGAGGEAIGQLVAERLGFRYVDPQIVTLAARQAQIDPALVAAAEKRQPLIQRLLEKIPRARDVASAVSHAAGVPIGSFASAVPGYRAISEDMRALIRAAIQEVARLGDAVIVAHGGSFALTKAAGVLRVFVTATADVRAKRLTDSERIDAAAADKEVATSDFERGDYLRRFYGVDEELPTHYDIVINTDVLTVEEAAAAIVGLAGARS